MASTYDGLLAELHKEIKKLTSADDLPNPNPGGVLTAQNDEIFFLIEMVEYYKDPMSINADSSGLLLKELRKKHSVKKLEAWMKKFQKGNFWKRLNHDQKSALLYGDISSSKEKTESQRKGVLRELSE